MEHCYTICALKILNDKTNDLTNLNELGIYLAKETNPNALKTLKLIILASENKKLNKEFEIDSVKSYKETILNDVYKRQETITNNLSINPQQLGLELMEFIIHNYPVNLHLTPYNSDYSLLDFWLRSFENIEYSYDSFYKRYDMIDKKLDIIDYLINNSLIDEDDINNIIYRLEACIERKYNYTEEQLFRMKEIINRIKLKEKISKLVDEKKIIINLSKDETINLLANNQPTKHDAKERKLYFRNELLNYDMTNDDCAYIYDTIPKLIREKKLK